LALVKHHWQKRWAKRLGWQIGYESVADNPYLADFYENMQQWSFHLQVFNLGHRANQHRALSESSQSAILDRSIYEDAHIFARALHQMSNISERDYQAYRAVYELVVQSLPRPDLMLYLKAPVPVLMDRINSRGRDIESGIPANYLELLSSFYDEWMASFDLCPVLTIHSENLDFVNMPEHLDIVVGRIQEKLMGKEDVIFT
jgi:deoxyadenosine/deoxycytidine kinase